MSSKHTPGPWKIDGRYITDMSGLRTIVILPQYTEVEAALSEGGVKAGQLCSPANARLIAASPDMLELLRDILPDYKHLAEESHIPQNRVALIERGYQIIAQIEADQ